jgi:hypothetical protein
MTRMRILAMTLASTAALALCGCMTARSSLTNSAVNLDRSADALARTVSDAPPGDTSDRYNRDVQALAEDAHAFRRTAEGHAASDADVRAAFDRVSRDYHAVRDDVDRSDSRTARDNLHPVTQSYLDVERDMSRYAGRPYPDRAYPDRPPG